MGRPDVQEGATDSPPTPALLEPKSQYNAMQCRNANIKKDEQREIRKEVALAYLKLLSDSG
jgi:hypothetical protein